MPAQIFACILALIVAMGIGRFSLTPQLPKLIAEGQLDLSAAGLLAAANYLGYLLGALDALNARTPTQIRLRLHGGLWACVLLALASAWVEGFWPHAWLRLAAGIASAWVLVLLTGLAQQAASHAGAPQRAGLIFCGPSLGVMLTGTLALAGNLLHGDSSSLWLAYGLLALFLVLALQAWLPRPTTGTTSSAGRPAEARPTAFYPLLATYSLVGFGYIIPATFLAQMASARFHGHWQADLFWPCFGLAATFGVVLAWRRRQRPDGTRQWLIASLCLQALGMLACLLPGMTGLALGALLTGGPFLACMQLVMQRAREIDPAGHSRNVALLTAGFALGQLCGPLLAAASSHLHGNLQGALYAAAAAMLLAAALMLPRPLGGFQASSDSGASLRR